MAALWSPVSGPYITWVAVQEMPFLIINVSSSVGVTFPPVKEYYQLYDEN